jgi:hypothetical protein
MLVHQHLSFWFNFLARKYPVSPTKLTASEQMRVEYYCKKAVNNYLGDIAIPVNSVSLVRKTGYAYDWYRIFDRKDQRLCNFAFGDVQYIATNPTFCKSRPIASDNANNVLLPLNTARHFNLQNDPLPYTKKKSNAIWRGAVYKDKRRNFLKAVKHSKLVDAADTATGNSSKLPSATEHYLPISAQMKSKFIFAIEGNDVASNLKWIMASNSVPVMPKPEFESWFCEGLLIPGQHYVEIKRDYSDVNEVLEYYLERPLLASEIAEESKLYANQFMPLNHQFAIASQVVKLYFSNTLPSVK